MKKIYITREEKNIRIWTQEKPQLKEDGFFYGDMEKTIVMNQEQAELLLGFDPSCIKEWEIVSLEITGL